MNKGTLVSVMAEAAGITKAQATSALNAALDAIGDSLKEGDRTTLVGFGTFSVSKRNARTGRNPKTGKPLTIEARNVVRFKPGKELSDKV